MYSFLHSESAELRQFDCCNHFLWKWCIQIWILVSEANILVKHLNLFTISDTVIIGRDDLVPYWEAQCSIVRQYFPWGIHPASRGVAAHTAGLFRSVRGAKGGFPPWGLPKLRIFTFPPVAPQAREFSLFPPVGAPQAREFSLFPPVGAPQAREFSLFPPVGAPQAREFSLSPPWGLPKLGNFHFSPPWGLPKLGNFHFSPPWQLPKLWNFHFSLPWRLSKLRNFK